MVIKLTLLYYRNLIKAGDKKKVLLYILLGLFLVGTFGMQCFALASGGAGISVPLLMYVYNCFFCLLAGVPSAKAVLFGFKDYDTQMAWPVSERAIVASRISIFLIAEELYSFLLLIPAFAAYAYFEHPGWQLLPIAIILTITAPILPSVVGSILGGFVAWLGGKFKGGKVFQYIGLLVVLIASMSFGMFSSRISQPGAGGTAAESIKAFAARIGPSALFGNAAAGSWLDVALFALMSVAICAVFMLIFGRSFRRMNGVVTAVATRGKFKQKKGSWKRTGVFSALLKKELGMLFGSPVYLLNSTFGAIMLIVVSALIAFVPLTKILGVFGAPAEALPSVEVLIAGMLPFVPLGLGWFAAMNCTTCASISMEGKRLSTYVSLPVKASRILLAKLLVNILINGICVVVCGILLSVRFRPDVITTVEIFAVPLLFSWFIAALGLRVNLWLPKLDWTTEQQAIKQSASAFITVFAGMIFAMVPILPAITAGVQTAVLWTMPVVAVIAALLTVLVFRKSERTLLKLL